MYILQESLFFFNKLQAPLENIESFRNKWFGYKLHLSADGSSDDLLNELAIAFEIGF
ncbi:hypothetical protein [Paenibacillus sp. FSL A5-0031]|uniref:hypothetical protein n=1 Tax=Paenibacillus sp. FSL A5-0031 TaxID=1920420 RepID=UPI0015C3FADB|nr:hypothetical protein [Paenibacillus sp. FSL A5-0031]